MIAVAGREDEWDFAATQFFSDGWKALVSYSFLLLTLWFFPNGLFGSQKEKM